jgi:hypothetical protein
VNNEQLESAQQSQLGVDLGSVVGVNDTIERIVMSDVGLADDVGLLSMQHHEWSEGPPPTD